MITTRERVQIGLGVIGLSFFGLGMAFFNFGPEQEEARRHSHGVGFWKDRGMTKDAEKRLAPWMLGTGIAFIAAAYIIRDR